MIFSVSHPLPLSLLCSESSSSIDASHSLSLKQQNYSKTPDGPPQPTHTAPANNNSHLPSSLAYDLSSKKVTSRTKKKQQLETTQRRRVSSFSRELSKHPLEVLKRRSVFGGWIQHTEQNRNQINKDYEPHISNENTLTDVTTKASSISPHKTMHVTTTTLEPPVAVVNRNRHMTAHRLSHASRESYHSPHTKTTNVVHEERDTYVESTSPLISPRRITMDLGVSFRDSSTSYHQLHLGGDVSAGRYTRVKPHIVHLPRHHLSISASSHRSARAYSEDESSIPSPEHGVELVACGESFSKVPETRFNHPKPEPIVENRTSVSPDYMLVGAHFTDDHLVLSDRGGNVVHHELNDTESDANIVPVSESNTAEPEQDIPKIESFDSKELLEKPASGVRAPPSTAAEEVQLSESEKFETAVQDTITEETEEVHNTVDDHSESSH